MEQKIDLFIEISVENCPWWCICELLSTHGSTLTDHRGKNIFPNLIYGEICAFPYPCIGNGDLISISLRYKFSILGKGQSDLATS